MPLLLHRPHNRLHGLPFLGRSIPEQQQVYAEQIQLLQQQQAQLQQLQQQLQLQHQQIPVTTTTPLHLLTQGMLGNMKMAPQPQSLTPTMFRNFVTNQPQTTVTWQSESTQCRDTFIPSGNISPSGGRPQSSPSPSPTLSQNFQPQNQSTTSPNFVHSPIQGQIARTSPSPNGSRHMQPSPNSARHMTMPYYTGYPSTEQAIVSSPTYIRAPEIPAATQPEGSFAPYLTMSTQRVLKFKPFTIQLHFHGSWQIKYSESEILRAGLSAKCRRESDLSENINRCFCRYVLVTVTFNKLSGKKRIIETGISSKEAFGPELQAGINSSNVIPHLK